MKDKIISAGLHVLTTKFNIIGAKICVLVMSQYQLCINSVCFACKYEGIEYSVRGLLNMIQITLLTSGVINLQIDVYRIKKQAK